MIGIVRKFQLVFFTQLVLISLLHPALFAQGLPGTIDSSFANHGRAFITHNFESFGSEPVHFTKNGFIVIASIVENNGKYQIEITKTSTAGDIQSDFGNNGTIIIQTNSSLTLVQSILIDDNNRIIVAGYLNSGELGNGKFLMRVTQQGQLDVSFGNNGIRFYNDDPYTSFFAIVEAGNNSYTAFGTTNNAGEIFAMQISNDGSRNLSFGGMGTKTITITNSYIAVYKSFPLNSGGILFSGTQYSSNFLSSSPIVFKLNSDLNPDFSFGVQGLKVIPITQTNDNDYSIANSIHLRPHGRVLVSGFSSSGGFYTKGFFLVMLDQFGAIETILSPNGVREFASSTEFLSEGVLLPGDDHISILGYSVNQDYFKPTIRRIGYDGELVTSYGINGSLTIELPRRNFKPSWISSFTDGGILFFGYSESNGNYLRSFFRITPLGVVDSGLGADGVLSFSADAAGNSRSRFGISTTTSDQSLLVASVYQNGCGFGVSLTKLSKGGKLLQEYYRDGVLYLNNALSPADLNIHKNQTTGSIYIYGIGTSATGVANLFIYKLFADGTQDLSYGNNGIKTFELHSYASDLSIVSIAFDYVIVAFITKEQNGILLFALNPDGSIDASWGQSGHNFISREAQSLKVLNSNLGNLQVAYSLANGFLEVIQYSQSGILDLLFGNDGVSVIPDLGDGNSVRDILSLDDGSTLVLLKSINAPSGFRLIKLSSNGMPDTGYGNYGISTPFINSFYLNPIDMAISQLDKLYILGMKAAFTDQPNTEITLLRLAANGEIDYEFDNQGYKFIRVSNQFSSTSRSLIFLSDDRIVITGDYSDQSIPETGVYAIRLNNDFSVTGSTYRFIGTGYWSEPANWLNQLIPPTELQFGSEIIIDPVDGGECILDVVQKLNYGSRIILKSGKQFRILSEILIQ